MPLLGIGSASFNGLGDYYGIGLGYCSLPTRKYCCEIGCIIKNTTSGECGDLVFSARSTTVNTDVAVERMRIKSNGLVGIATTNPLTRFTIKSSYNDENSALCIDAGDGNTYNLKLYPYVIAGGRVGYKFKVNNISSSTETLFLGDNGSVGIGSIDTSYKLYVNGNSWFNGTGYFNGSFSTLGDITSGPNSYVYAGGLRIGGWDGNTFYNGNRILGLTTNSGYTITFNIWGGTPTTVMTIGNNYVDIAGYLTVKMSTTTNSQTDYVGVSAWPNSNLEPNNTDFNRRLYIMYQTFTGFHRVFTEDEKFNKEEPQKFKDDYIGRLVVSIGKIATDLKNNNNLEEEWEIKYDKEGITIEDALPMIELTRKRKDKRVFGVLGSPNRNNSRLERLVVNSVGEGGIWVCNSNGNIENGDYITSSNYLGYGEKQDDDLFHNFIV